MVAASAAGAERHAGDPDALARAGTEALDQRRFGDALDAFNTALSIRPDEATACFGAGVAAFMLGQDGVAETRFQCVLAADPNHLSAATWLGDLYYRTGRLSEAIAIYERQQRSSSARHVRRQLDAWRKEYTLERRFRSIRSEHFATLFEAARDEPLARDVLARLESAYSRVGHALGAYPSRPVTVVLYTRKQFREITGLAEWAVAAYDGRIRLPLAGALPDADELDRVLSHEFVHAVVAMLGGRTVPAWMNEGLATVLEPGGVDDAERTLAGRPMRQSASKRYGSFVDLPTRDAEAAYASAALAVQRLIDDHGVAVLLALLEDLSRGTTFDRAFTRRVGTPYDQFASPVGMSPPFPP